MSMNWIKNIKRKHSYALVVLTYVLVFIAFFFLHNKQMHPNGTVYMSDMVAHYDEYNNGAAYSYMELIVRPITRAFGTVGFAVLVSIFQVISIFTVSIIFYKKFNIDIIGATILAFLVKIEMAIWLPSEGYFYLYTMTGTIWHNSTYLFMETFALISIFYLFSIIDLLDFEIDKKTFAHEVILFSIYLSLATCAKPNFVFGLAPALLVYLLIHCIVNKFRYIANEFCVGTAVLPSVFIALTQGNKALTGGGLAWMPGALWNPFSHLGFISLLRSMAFVLCVLICYYNLYYKNKVYSFLWLLCLIGYLEAVCIVQPDPAVLYHGNITWTAFICFIPLYIYSAGIMIKELRNKKKDIKNYVCMIFFVWHTISGAYFLYNMLIGGRYDIPLI